MAKRQLTYEEANKLLETVLILIRQQNTAQKQKSNKNKLSPFTTSSDVPMTSPSKPPMKQPKHQPLEFPTIQQQFDFSRSPFKKVIQTPHKLSIDKESTFLEFADLSQEGQFKLIEKQESCLELANRTSIMSSSQEVKIPTQMVNQSCQKPSQLPQHSEQRLYPESSVKDLKRDLQIQSKGKICKTQNLNSETGQIQGYHFLCKSDSDCPFDCYLEFTQNRTPKGQKIYRLISHNQTHLKNCLQEEEEINFMKLTKVIDTMESSIQKLLSQDPQLKPKDILSKIAEELGEADHKFIYKGLNSKNYHKAAKKYFDNLIYKVKNPAWTNT